MNKKLYKHPFSRPISKEKLYVYVNISRPRIKGKSIHRYLVLVTGWLEIMFLLSNISKNDRKI